MKKLLFLAATIFLFASCKKEVTTIDRNAVNNEKQFKTKELRIYERGNASSYLVVNMTSENEKMLNKVFEKLSNSYVELIEVDPNQSSDEPNSPLTERDSIGITYHLNWDNFNFMENQGKMYFISIRDKIAKSVDFLYTLPNVSSFSTTAGLCKVSVQSTFSRFNFSCMCTKSDAWWYFNRASNYTNTIDGRSIQFFEQLQMETYNDLYGNPAYLMRYNLGGSGLPSGAAPTNSIKSASGTDYFAGGTTPGYVSMWIWR